MATRSRTANQAKQASSANQGKQQSPLKGCLTLIVFVAVIVIIIAAVSGGGSSSSPAKDAASYISAHGQDASTVQAGVQDVLVAVGLAEKSPTSDNVNQVAQLAQQAHDSINNIRDNFATSDTSGKLGNAEVEVFTAANDLKNAMGALVAYSGNPNPATLAQFSTQYQNAKQEWNDGVSTIWSTAANGSPPTL